MRCLLFVLVLFSVVDSHSWFDGAEALLSNAASGFMRVVQNAAEVQISGLPLAFDDLCKPLLCSRLSDVAYSKSADEIRRRLQKVGDGRLTLVYFHAQTTLSADHSWFEEQVDAQWFVAKDSSEASLYIVFRGTHTLADLMHDLQAMPSDGFHQGFLQLVRRCTRLHELLQRELEGM